MKNWLSAHRTTAILAVLIILILSAALFTFQKIASKTAGPVEEVDLIFDAEGPYAQTFPRKDGNALILNLKRTSSYDSISYELAYTSKVDETAVSGNKILEDEESGIGGSIDRGVVGTIDTKEKKGEYEQEILFGTCSKNVCKYDKGVENGTLTLHIRKGDKAYRMITQWHLQQPDVALGVLSSGDGHFIYKVDASRETLSNTGFSIINDLTGVPKLPPEKVVSGKVYALNIPIAKSLSVGEVTIELVQNPSDGTKIYRFYEPSNEWQELDTKVDGAKLTATAEGSGIFAVLTFKK